MSFDEKTREVAGLFELSVDDEDEILNNNDLLFELGSKLKTKKKKNKSSKRLKGSVKNDLNDDDSEDNDNEVYDFKSGITFVT
jgi:hypothetical protein